MHLSTLLLLAATIVLSNGNADTAGGLQVRLLTFNIRYGTANDGDNAWPHRQEMVGNVMLTRL